MLVDMIKKISGVLVFLFAVTFGIYYSICIFYHSGLLIGFKIPFSPFPDNFLGIPLLSIFWTLALPIYLLVLLMLLIMGWVGISTLLLKKPRISDEELHKVMELEKKHKKKQEESKK